MPERTIVPWERPVVAALAVASAVAVLVATRARVAITPDSVTYVSAAHNLAAGQGYTDLTGQALTNFPPGYPALLAAADRLGISPWTAGRYLGALVIAVVVVLTYLLARRHLRSTASVIGATALVACSTQLLGLGGAIASDALFVALTLGLVLTLDHLRTTERHAGALLVAAAGLVAVAFLVKYAAVALLVTAAVSVVVVSRPAGLGTALRRAAAFTVMAAVVPVLWVVRNASTDNPDVLGFRVSSSLGVPALVKGFLLGAVRVVVPTQVSNTAALALLAVALVAVVVVVWPLRRGVIVEARRDARALAPLAVVVVGFGAFLLLSERSVGADDMPRQFLPMWPIAVVLAAAFLEWVRTVDKTADQTAGQTPDPTAGRRSRPWRSTVLVVGAVALIGGSAAWTLSTMRSGVPTLYDGRDASAELASAVGDIPASALVISNDPWQVQLRTGREPVQLAPVRPAAGFSHRPMVTDDVRLAACRGDVVLLWFGDAPTTGSQPPDAAIVDAAALRLVETGAFPGGRAYRVEAAAGC